MSGYSSRGFSIATSRHVKHTTLIKKIDADATYGVLQDSVDEKCHICHKYTDPVRVRSLSNCPLQDVRLVDSFEKYIKASTIRYQRRLFQVSATTIAG